MLNQTASVETLYAAMLTYQQQLRQLAADRYHQPAPLALDRHLGPHHVSQPHLEPHHVPRFAMDPNMRRKNATRESTSILKSWLEEHRKNPYPTKGEKIMLAIITKMTLTQVSTWFANARRRLKKDNRVTWLPRNRCGEDGEDEDDLPIESDGDSVEDYGVDSVEMMRRRHMTADLAAAAGTTPNTVTSREHNEMLILSQMRSIQEDAIRRRLALESQKRKEVFIDVGTEPSPAVFPSAYQLPLSLTTSGFRSSISTSTSEDADDLTAKKPKIWSVAEVAADKPSRSMPTSVATTPSLFPFPVAWLQHPAALALRSAFGSSSFPPPQFPQVSSTQQHHHHHQTSASSSSVSRGCTPSPLNRAHESADEIDRSSPIVSILGRRRRMSGSSSTSASSCGDVDDELNSVSAPKSMALNLHQIASLTR